MALTKITSKAGSPRAITGITIDNENAVFCAKRIEVIEKIQPINKLPASPRKILAGCLLNIKKPIKLAINGTSI